VDPVPAEDADDPSLKLHVVYAVDDWIDTTVDEHHDDGEVVEVTSEVAVRITEVVH